MAPRWNDRDEELTRLRNQGWTLSRIAEHFNTTRNAVAGRCKRLGLHCPENNPAKRKPQATPKPPKPQPLPPGASTLPPLPSLQGDLE